MNKKQLKKELLEKINSKEVTPRLKIKPITYSSPEETLNKLFPEFFAIKKRKP